MDTEPQSTPTPNRLKLVASIIATVIGALILVVGVFTLSFPTVLIGFAIGLPGVWWFLHERRAKAGVPMARHWGAVSVVSIAALLGGGALLPDASDSDDVQAVVETTSTTPTTTAPTTSTTTSTTSPASSTVPAPTTEEPAAAAVIPGDDDDTHVDVDTPRHIPDPVPAYTPDPEPAYTPAPAPEPVYTPDPAPVVEQPSSTSYENCDAVRAAGAAPIYAGQPGYASHLDRDGDGIGCENS